MGKHLVLIGGGHAHMTAMINISDYVRKGHQVSLVSSAPFHYYSGMGPGMLSGIYRPEEIRFNVKRMVEDRGALFVQGTVVRVEPERRILVLNSGEEISYDVASFNTGSHVPIHGIEGVTEEMVTVKPIVKLLEARQWILERLQQAPDLLVAGGGAAGLEMAGNLQRLVKDHGGKSKITLLAGHKLLGRFPEKVQKLAVKSLTSRGVEVVERSRVKRFERGQALLEDGRAVSFDLAFLALGVKPSPLFRESGLPTGEDGGLLVNTFLQSVAYPEIFGGGDCISLEERPLDKVGVYAVRQNPILFHNLLAALEGNELMPFDPGGSYLLILNLGNGKGIFWKNEKIWDGRTAFLLKNYIDRRFMRKFQVSGECSS